MKDEKALKGRPYWHVDAKWIFGILFAIVFSLAFLSFNLFVLTGRDNAVKISSVLLSNILVPGGIKDTDITKIRDAISKSPNKAVKPFSGFDITITENDLNQNSSAQLTNKLFNQLALNVYDNTGSNVPVNLGLASIFTKKAHDSYAKSVLELSVISIVLLILLIIFSSGFGRLLSPGIIFFAVGFLFYLFFSALQKNPTGTNGGGVAGQAGSILANAGPVISETILKYSISLTFLGIVLIVIGIVGSLIPEQKTS